MSFSVCCCCYTVRNPARNDGAPAAEAVQAEDQADGRDATGDTSENVIN